MGKQRVGKTDEQIEDIVNALVSGGNNVTASYDDANDTLTIGTSALDTEEVEDAVASLMSTGSDLSLTYDDSVDTLTVSLADSVSVSTLEATTSITDAANVNHTGELADLGDPVTDFGVGTLGDGEFLQNSSGSLTGATVSAGLERITEATASNDAEVVLSLTGFDTYIIQISNLAPADNNNGAFKAQFSTDGGSTFNSADNWYSTNQFGRNTARKRSDSSASEIELTGKDPFSNSHGSYHIKVINANDSSLITNMNGRFEYAQKVQQSGVFGGSLEQLSSVDAIRFFFGFANITRGTFRVFGVN